MEAMSFWNVLVVAVGIGTGLVSGQEHPRWLFPKGREGGIRARMERDPLFRKVVDQVMVRADQALGEKTCDFGIPEGGRLRMGSRHALHQVLHCGVAWRLSGEEKYRQRVVREVEAACGLEDWNPAYFLDVAEMSTAVALAYDWLYPTLSDGERERWLDALEYKALHPLGKMHPESDWWGGPTDHWSQVCGTGMAYAAEMVTDRRKEWRGLYRRAAELVVSCRAFYEPAGAYPEGSGSLNYGSHYQVLMQAADRRLEVSRFLSMSGNFMMQMTGPSGRAFDVAEGGLRWVAPSAAQSWLATRFRDVVQARYVRRMMAEALEQGIRGETSSDLRFFPLHVLWFPEEPKGPVVEASRVDVFEGVPPVASLRSGWSGDAAWIAIQGGHGHLDAGSFVYEAKGQRWFHVLGEQQPPLAESSRPGQRDFSRLRTVVPSSLLIGGGIQEAAKSGLATVVEESEREGVAELAVDLSPIYRSQAELVERRLRFRMEDGACVMEDDVKSPKGEVRWAVLTRAEVEFRGAKAILRQGGRELVLNRLDASGGRWQEYPIRASAAQEGPLGEFRLVGFTVPAKEVLKIRVGWE